jgi:hypothetical protein
VIGLTLPTFHDAHTVGIGKQFLWSSKRAIMRSRLIINGSELGLGLRDKRKGFQDRARHVRPLLVECVNSQKPTYTRQKKGRAEKVNSQR